MVRTGVQTQRGFERKTERKGEPRRIIPKRSPFASLAQARPETANQMRLAVQIHIDFDFTIHWDFLSQAVSFAGRRFALVGIRPPDPSRADPDWHPPDRPDARASREQTKPSRRFPSRHWRPRVRDEPKWDG